jgi:hypothetical protein
LLRRLQGGLKVFATFLGIVVGKVPFGFASLFRIVASIRSLLVFGIVVSIGFFIVIFAVILAL